MKTLTEFELGYIASAIDCEGTIAVNRRLSKSESGNYNYDYSVSVYNTNNQLLEYLKDVTGIGIIYPRKKQNLKWKQSYDWSLRIEEMQEFLQIIASSLVLKQEQAYLMLEILKIGEDQEMRNIIFYQMKELNRKGSSLEEKKS